MKERKREQIDFYDKLRGKALEEDEAEYDRLTSNRKFYSVARGSRTFINSWLLQRCSNKRVLDYGCGTGGISLLLLKNNATVAGIDISGESISKTRNIAILDGVDKNASFFIMDAENLAFDNDSFDIIVCTGILHHLDIQKAFAELARVLKPNGQIVCGEPLAHNPIIQLYRRMTPHLRTKWEVEHILTKSSIRLAGRYFSRVETRFFHLSTLAAVPFRNLPGFSLTLSFLEAVDEVILKLPLLKWQAWQIVLILSQPNKSLFKPQGA